MRLRPAGAAAVLVLVTLMTAACGSPGTHLQSPVATSTPPTSSLPDPLTSPAPSQSWTPPDYGSAQPAVDAYLHMVSVINKAFEDPTHVSSATFDKYLGGQAKITFDQELVHERMDGRAYRGTPAERRVRVVTNKVSATLPEVVLRDCALASTSDPFVEYDVTTGKVVPQRTPKVPPPYAQTAKLFKINGVWQMTSYTTDSTKTCSP
jgi:hypothetical protein